MAEKEERQFLIPTSYHKTRRKLGGWFAWLDLIIALPAAIAIIIPFFVMDIQSTKNLIILGSSSILILIIAFGLIYPFGALKGYELIIKLFHYLFSFKKYKSPSAIQKFAFPFDRIEGKYLVSKLQSATVIRIKGVDIELFGEEKQNQNVNIFANVFHECSSAINIIKFRRRQDYLKWADNLRDSLNKEIEIFIRDHSKVIKNWKVLEKQLQKDQITPADIFEKHKSQLPTVQVVSFEARLNAMALNIGKLENLNAAKTFEPVYFILLKNHSRITLENDTKTVMSILDSINHDPKQLEGFEISAFVSSYFVRNNVKVSNKESTLEGSLPISLTFKRKHYQHKINIYGEQQQRFCKVINISNFPLYVSRSWLSNLLSAFNNSFIIKTKDFDNQAAQSILNDKIKISEDNLMLAKDTISKNRFSKEVVSLRETLKDLQNGLTMQHASVYVLFVADSKPTLFKELNDFKRKVRSLGDFKINPMDWEQREAYIAMLPTSFDNFTRKNSLPLPTNVLAEGYPISVDKFQDENTPMLGLSFNGSPIMINIKKRTSQRTNSNLLFLGIKGAGKTSLAKLQIKNLAAEGTKNFIIDPQSEFGAITEYFNGTVIDMSGDESNWINPLQFFETSLSEDEENLTKGLSVEKQWSEFISRTAIILSSAVGLSLLEQPELPGILNDFYKKHKIGPQNSSKIKDSKWPILEELVKYIKSTAVKQTKQNSWGYKNYQEIYMKFGRALRDPQKASLWNHHTNIKIKDVPITTFDTLALSRLTDSSIQTTQKMIIFDFINKEIAVNKEKYFKPIENIESILLKLEKEKVNLKTDKLKALHQTKIDEYILKQQVAREVWKTKWINLVIDEVHTMFDEDHPESAKFIYEKAKTMRKFHGILTLITQNVGDFTKSKSLTKYTEGIINNAQYIFAMKQSSGDVKDLDDILKKSGGITPSEKIFLTQASQGQALCLFTGSQERVLLQAHISEEEFKMIGEGVR